MSCKGCAYAVFIGKMWCCDYLLLPGHRRPCPPGKSCTVRKKASLTKKWSTFMAKRKWDTEKAAALYAQGWPDGRIAAEVGVPASAVAFWRRGQNLPPNKEGPSLPKAVPETAVPETEVPETAPETEKAEPGKTPALTGPLSLSVELNGCAFSLRAPDAESAARIYEYAGRLLGDLFGGKA